MTNDDDRRDAAEAKYQRWIGSLPRDQFDLHMMGCRAYERRGIERAAEWQPIETAPKDGTEFDVWVPDAFGGYRMCGLSFNTRGKLRQHGRLTEADLPRWPTHWMPPPAPPPSEP